MPMRPRHGLIAVFELSLLRLRSGDWRTTRTCEPDARVLTSQFNGGTNSKVQGTPAEP